MSLLGIDIGLTMARGLVISEEGQPLAQAQGEYHLLEGPAGPRMLDARDVWAAVRGIIATVAQRTGRDPIRALSISSIGEILVPVASDGRIIGNCLVETHATASCEERVLQRLGRERVYDLTGNIPSGSSSLSNLCWVREHHPEVFRDAWRFLPLSSLVSLLLGGASTCDQSLAGRTLLFDLARERWARQVLDAAGLPESKLPDVEHAGSLVGIVSAGAARELGLPSGVQLVLGGHERCCSALGMGVIRSGMAVYTLAGVVSMTPAFQAVPLTSLMMAQGLGIQPHVVPRLFVSYLYNHSGGSLLRWFRDTLGPAELRQAERQGVNAYDHLLSRIPEGPTGLLVFPHFGPVGPPYLNEQTSGAILGLGLNSTRDELVKALLEGLTLYFAAGRQLLERAGVRLDVLRATGPGVRSAPWLQLTADVFGLPVEYTGVLSPAPFGAAMLAGVGSQRYAGLSQAADTLIRAHSRYEPDAQRHAAYEDRLTMYDELYPALRPYLQCLAATMPA